MKNSDEYRHILENLEDAYFEVDLAGRFTFFNRSTLELLGYTSDEMMHMSYRQHVSEETAGLLYGIFNEVYRTGKPKKTVEYEVIAKDGSRWFRETSISLKRDDKGTPVGFRCIARDVTRQRLAYETLQRKDHELAMKSKFLAESNTALKSLLKIRENDKRTIESNVITNVERLVMPFIGELKKSRLSSNQSICLEIIENNLKDITSPFLRNLTIQQFNLTPREIQVATLVKEGRNSGQIADILNLSKGAVDFHRNNIRKKVGINKEKVNLHSFLLKLDDNEK